MKHYRPHILVVVALAIVLSSGWHGMLRNALTDLRFAWVSRQATGDVVLVAIDAPSIEKIGVWPWPRCDQATYAIKYPFHWVNDPSVCDTAEW